MKLLYSHPTKLLQSHLDEVAEAANIIASYHSLTEVITRRLDELVRLHDFGKATSFFQDYISYQPEPKDWPGRKENKAHTLIGFLAATKLKERQNFSDDWLLQVGTSIVGHHSLLPSRKDIDKRFHDAAKVLIKQLHDLPLQELERHTKFSFDKSDFTASEETVFDAMDCCEELFEWLDDLELADAVQQRLKTQLIFSILLEADKAFLALSKDAQADYKKREFTPIPLDVIGTFLNNTPASPINTLRTQARVDALRTLSNTSSKKIFTLTLPTGLGKTLTAASLAFQLREQQKRQVIIVLPFLAIVDQTSKVYDDVLNKPSENTVMQSHSLSARDYLELEDGDADFFLDTWQSDIVITTFDQVLLALLSSRAKHQMRFHHLCDAVIIFDEIQALPTHLWDVTQNALHELSSTFNSTLIAMSATQPGFINKAQELIPNVQDIFKHFGRYQLVLKHKTDLPLVEFIEMLTERYERLKEKRVLITLNTRASARRVFDDLSNIWQTDECPIYFLTADVTPIDRLEIIGFLKTNLEPCLVISTQVVEAGVDIDMDLVLRDFAPLDSLIQVAGRCNRNNLKPRCDVEFYSLINDKGKRYSSMVYRKTDGSADISLQETRKALENYHTIPEEAILGLCDGYFAAIRNLEDLGQNHTKNWAYFKEHLDVSKLLRGEQDNQYQFIVPERDRGDDDLKEALRSALDIKDRWEKRRALRKLASRLALVTVTIWGKRGFDPANVAYQVGFFWFVYEGTYDAKRGLDLGLGSPDDSSFL